ncbi:flagellar motor protein MotB [Anoxybacter fermentans]|uniref:Flagellar motor protein MotB n=1 Tax=Anoxybacter fermentans TaxID=1323375 RepID=A0A3S9T040_9FIRM|nr:OmpA family protein [Anoxybacter fermentans]AZR73870.1 flagellar motor protein MotB [Anoxybacter fermentans]
MRKKVKTDDEMEISAPGWMVTYGDMMTLLLCFFVLLYSFSTIDVARFKDVMNALKARLGVLDGGRTFNPSYVIDRGLQNDNISASYYDNREFKELISKLEEYIKEANLQANVRLAEEERGLVIRLTGKILFDLGKADLKPDGMKTLAQIAKFLEDIPNSIMIEGHTDNWPIHNEEFPNNWVLSAIRATNVIAYFMEKTNIDPKRLSVAAYGEYRPLKPNTTPENRALNRRVDIVVLRTRLDEKRIAGEGYDE